MQMAVHATHAVSIPPAAPVRETTRHLMLRAYCTFVVFTAFAGSAWNNLLGPVGFGVLIALLALVSVLLWALPTRRRTDVAASRFAWRRLPWLPLAYAAWALASVLWTHWLDATLITWGVLAGTTLQALFVASMLTWSELVRGVASALKWVMGLSLLFELWAALFTGPILPDFVTRPEGRIPPELYWTRANLFDGGRIQGIVGNSNLLAMAALVAIIVFAIRMATVPRRGWLIAWTVLSVLLLVRAQSATAYLAAGAVALVLATALLMRTARRPGERTRWYVLYAAVGVVATALLWLFHDAILSMLGRSDDLTGRQAIWDAVLERAWQHPVVGWGFSTPWLPWEPAFDGWIVDHDLTVFMAHSVWLDVFFQLGFVGVAIMALLYLAYIWRSWFFAVDRPRWDLKADRPYSAITLLPTLVGTVLLVQGVSESRPLMEWGWFLIVLLAFKIKQSPHVGEGPAEQTLAIERGELPRRTA